MHTYVCAGRRWMHFWHIMAHHFQLTNAFASSSLSPATRRYWETVTFCRINPVRNFILSRLKSRFLTLHHLMLLKYDSSMNCWLNCIVEALSLGWSAILLRCCSEARMSSGWKTVENSVAHISSSIFPIKLFPLDGKLIKIKNKSIS